MAKHTKHLSVWDKTFNWFELKPIWIYKFFIPKDQSIILPITNTSFFFIMENYFIWIEAVSDVILHATSMVWNPQLNKKNPPLFRIQNNWDNSNKRCFRCFFIFPDFLSRVSRNFDFWIHVPIEFSFVWIEVCIFLLPCAIFQWNRYAGT